MPVPSLNAFRLVMFYRTLLAMVRLHCEQTAQRIQLNVPSLHESFQDTLGRDAGESETINIT